MRVFGDVRDGHFGLEIVHPQFKVVADDAPLPDRLTPVYPTTAGLGAGDAAQGDRAHARCRSGAARRKRCPSGSSRAAQLWKFGDAVRFLHAPPPRLSPLDAARARRAHASGVDAPQVRRAARAAAVAQGASPGARAARRAPVLTGTGALTDALLARVPFKLTRAQERVWREIAHDLKRATPMQRLLQGDVGSGKTIVAALAALQAIESGRQVAFMAPTEILAEQHYRKLAAWLDGLPVQVAWLSGRLAGEGAPGGARGARERRGACSRSARTRCSRTTSSCRGSGSRSSTSSIASASRSGSRCAARGWAKRTS